MAKGKELYDVYKPQKQTTMTQVHPYGAAASTANNNRTLYGGNYDADLNALYGQIANRPKFSYDVDGDALYQQYKDRYTKNARMAMQDTMGQAAALTGGYGSSYGQAVGQQAYDRQMLGLTDKIPELQQNAYNMYLNEGNELNNRFGLLNSMAAAEQATTQQAYSQLAQMISASGYQPTADDLKRAGMNAQQANALRQMWIASNPAAAYVNGALSASDYFKLTGQQPPDVAAAQKAAASGPAGPKAEYDPDVAALQNAYNQNASLLGKKPIPVTGINDKTTEDAANALNEYNKKMAIHYGLDPKLLK